jgi:glutaredoxin 3
VAYQAVDVTTDPNGLRDLMTKSGQRGVPVIDVDGEIVVGFDKERLDQILKKA